MKVTKVELISCKQSKLSVFLKKQLFSKAKVIYDQSGIFANILNVLLDRRQLSLMSESVFNLLQHADWLKYIKNIQLSHRHVVEK